MHNCFKCGAAAMSAERRRLVWLDVGSPSFEYVCKACYETVRHPPPEPAAYSHDYLKSLAACGSKEKKMNRNTDAFVNATLQNTSAECQIRITQFQSVYDCMAEGFKKQGLSGTQITDILWARLSATCPQCGCRISGEDLGNLWMMGSIGFDRVTVFGPGRAPRFGKGMCPNQSCPGAEIVLRWDAQPADDLSPFTPMDGDSVALKTYWRKLAREWWKTQTRNEAICDKCMAAIPRGEGYYSPGIYADLACEKCAQRRLSPDRLSTLYREKGNAAREELRTARQSAGISPASDDALEIKAVPETVSPESVKSLETHASGQSSNLPWDWSTKAPEDGSEFLQSLRGSLPTVFRAVGKPGRDPVVMLVDVEDIRWRGLLALLHTRHGQPYFSPETVTGEKPQIQQDSAGPFYRPPTIEGKELRVGLYVVERDWLVSELCWIRGLPIPFLKQVKKAQTPKGMFTIVYFLKTHLGVRHVSPDASVCEAPDLSLSDLV